MKKIIDWLSNPPVEGNANIFMLRFMVGTIFFWEGILKFVYTNQGVGRFTKLGMPFPDKTATFIALLEIVLGLTLVLGLYSRISALVLAFEMVVAILMTKVDLYFGTSPLPLPVVPPQVGIWALLHEIRTDYALLVTAVFIALEGPGKFSFDYRLKKRSYSVAL